MSSEVIKLNLIPKGEMPVFHCSQFDNGRLITIELYRGEDAYEVPAGYTVELHCRKVDNNIVTLASTLVNTNVVTFTSTTQLTACNGKNLCEVAIKAADDYLIGTLNFWLEVELDPLKGGINSTSEIHDLYEQIEEITAEVIGDDYYDKTEVDNLLDAKADKTTTYTKTQVDTLLTAKADKSNVYTKAETTTLLAAKADADNVYTKAQVETKLAAKADAAAVYTKDETDTLLDAKANANAVYSKVEVNGFLDEKADADTTTAALATKADKSDTYTKEQVDAIIDNMFPTFTATGAIASFTTALTKPLVSVIASEGATTVTRCGLNFWKYGNQEATRKKEIFNVNSIKAGSYTFSANVTTQAVSNPRVIFYYPDNTSTAISLTAGTRSSATFTLTQTPITIELWAGASAGESNDKAFSFTDIQLELGNQASEFHAYTGNTVPVADATTLVTLSGVNNVYADVGNVTVQYKYMSM